MNSAIRQAGFPKCGYSLAFPQKMGVTRWLSLKKLLHFFEGKPASSGQSSVYYSRLGSKSKAETNLERQNATKGNGTDNCFQSLSLPLFCFVFPTAVRRVRPMKIVLPPQREHDFQSHQVLAKSPQSRSRNPVRQAFVTQNRCPTPPKRSRLHKKAQLAG